MTRPSLSTASAGLRVWNGSRPGASGFTASCRAKNWPRGSASRCRCAAARSQSRIPHRATECRRRPAPRNQPLPSRWCRPHRLRRPRRCLLAVDLRHLGIEKCILEVAIKRTIDSFGIGHNPVANAKGAFGRFDEAVDKFETLRSRTARRSNSAKMISEASLGRRRRVVKCAASSVAESGSAM